METQTDRGSAGGSRERSRRLAELLELIAERRRLSLTELTEQFGTSAATVRRDLAVLAQQGLVVRYHGGVRAAQSLPEIPVALRDTRYEDAKRRIAVAAAARVPRQRHAVAIGGGTTTAGVARELADRPELTIVTNSLTIATLVAGHPQLKVLMTGGILRPQSLELVGLLAESAFSAVNVGVAILGVDGISAEEGLTTHDETESRTNRAMVAKAQRTIVVADGSKVGKAALAKIADVDQVATLVTDSSADGVALDAIRARGVDVVVV